MTGDSTLEVRLAAVSAALEAAALDLQELVEKMQHVLAEAPYSRTGQSNQAGGDKK